MTTLRANRHYWLPVPNEGTSAGTRHAFRGPRWEGRRQERTVCGKEVGMAQPSEMDWILFPTCADCFGVLKGEG
ncbi:hypothetical protein QFW96_22820 [Saccharopolyspora sp. TS4A08]|uniref:Uncharacterized protein n=1 Tax=Saccharopolyspora ipomoeae TaxID=3042027 RepID=A0ABT6PTZ6_9PSEU|nr:hypothetical protein [Saccharopolyspora sp. TS4A08]MDI2031479.1 hypothetical protein [Saccharopolyspora sp. TS4A08]